MLLRRAGLTASAVLSCCLVLTDELCIVNSVGSVCRLD